MSPQWLPWQPRSSIATIARRDAPSFEKAENGPFLRVALAATAKRRRSSPNLWRVKKVDWTGYGAEVAELPKTPFCLLSSKQGRYREEPLALSFRRFSMSARSRFSGERGRCEGSGLAPPCSSPEGGAPEGRVTTRRRAGSRGASSVDWSCGGEVRRCTPTYGPKRARLNATNMMSAMLREFIGALMWSRVVSLQLR
jgi:hypothetical protein